MTVAEKIEIAQASQFLAANAAAKGGLYKDGNSGRLPRLLYMIRKNVERLYNLSPSDSTLIKTSNYMYSLCAPFSLKAQSILGGGGTIASVVPVSTTSVFPIAITQANFTTATEYNDTRIVGENLRIFYNEINRYLVAGEWSYTVAGVQILIPGFDALAVGASMNMVIEKVTEGATPGGGGSSVVVSWYYGDTDYYSHLIASNDDVPYNGSSSGTIGSPISVTFPPAAVDGAIGKYLVFKVASSMNDKTSWANTGTLNSGNIPDTVFREQISFGDNDYYLTRPISGGGYIFDPSTLTMVLT